VTYSTWIAYEGRMTTPLLRCAPLATSPRTLSRHLRRTPEAGSWRRFPALVLAENPRALSRVPQHKAYVRGAPEVRQASSLQSGVQEISQPHSSLFQLKLDHRVRLALVRGRDQGWVPAAQVPVCDRLKRAKDASLTYIVNTQTALTAPLRKSPSRKLRL